MGLYDECVADTGRQCPLLVDRLLAELDDEDAADLRRALGDPAVSNRAIASVLRKRGFTIASGSVWDWRQRNS